MDVKLKIVPTELLEATHSSTALRALHTAYWRRYGGFEGVCTRAQAFTYLVEDLRYYNLPVRYRSYNSFASALYRKSLPS